MKKYMIFFMLCTVFAILFFLPAYAEDETQSAVIQTLENEYGAPVQLLSFAQTQDNTLGAVAYKVKGKNVLSLLYIHEGKYTPVFHTQNALYQGNRVPELTFETPSVFWISYGTHENDRLNADMEFYQFTLQNALFTLTYCEFFYMTDAGIDTLVYVSNDNIAYSLPPFEEKEVVYTQVERSLENFQIALFPKESTYEMFQPLSNNSSTMHFEILEVPLKKGGRYPVYTAPDKASFRSAGGKALVSTNDWVHVYGQDGDFLLVEYSVSDKMHRFGYISDTALQRNTNVKELIFSNKYAYTLCDTYLTDDPVKGFAPLTEIQKGESLLYLADFSEDYAYVEYNDGRQKYRGFIAQNDFSYYDE